MFLTHQDIKLSNLSYEKLQDLCGPHIRYNSVVDLLLKTKKEYCDFLETIHPETFYRIVYLHRGRQIIPILETCVVLDQIGGMLSSFLHDYDRHEIESGELNISETMLQIWDLIIKYDNMTFLFPSSKNLNSHTNKYMQKAGFNFSLHDEFRVFSTYENPSFCLLVPISKIFTNLLDPNSITNISHFNFKLFSEMKLIQKEIIATWFKEG